MSIPTSKDMPTVAVAAHLDTQGTEKGPVGCELGENWVKKWLGIRRAPKGDSRRGSEAVAHPQPLLVLQCRLDLLK
jgi:hypothetical protein